MAKEKSMIVLLLLCCPKHQEVNNMLLVVAAATIKTYGQRTDGRQEEKEEDRPCLKQRLYAIMPRGNHG